MENQPKEILLKIALDLPLRSLLNLCQTSSKYKKICNDENFWRQRLYKDYKFIREKDAKRVYLEILQNKELCQEFLKKLDEEISFIPTPEYFLQNGIIQINFEVTGGQVVLNYLEDKIFSNENITFIPDYFPVTYRRYILPIINRYPQLSFITGEEKVTNEENNFYLSQLKIARGKLKELSEILPSEEDRNRYKIPFLVVDGILKGRIPLKVRMTEICKYPLFTD